MKISPLNNAVQVSDIDLDNDDECRELGRLIASECVVFLDQSVSEKRLFEIQCLWGQPSRPLLHSYMVDGLLRGRHWRDFQVHLAQISRAVDEITGRSGMVRVSFEKTTKGKPTGIFTNGELDWHFDNQSIQDSQRVVGLMSLWASAGSRTSFLCTAKAYQVLSAEDKSIVDELHTVWEWDGGTMSKDLDPSQLSIIRYGTVPYAGLESKLVDVTASGVKGISYPSHSFSHFKGMSRNDSLKYREHLWSLINKPEYIYHQDWKDGQIVFMDQNITLHARPTNVKAGNKRTMCRMISYMDTLYPDEQPFDYVQVDGQKIGHPEFVKMVDAERYNEFYADRKTRLFA